MALQIEHVELQGDDLLLTVRVPARNVPVRDKTAQIEAIRKALVSACLALDADQQTQRARINTILSSKDRARLIEVIADGRTLEPR